MRSFTFSANPARVVFGSGTIAQLPQEVERLGCKRVLVLTTPQQEGDARRTAAAIGDRCAGVFAGAVMHTPVNVTETAMGVVADKDIDGLVAVGGGSTTGLAKAIALRTDLPQIVAPTTYAGSEMTPILGETKDGSKVTQNSPKVLPEVVIYDVELTLTLPPRLSGTSGINAIAHAVEALYARDRNPITTLMAREAIKVLSLALPIIVREPTNMEARSDALYGAWLCGSCLGTVGMSIHHKFCHTLGGTFDLPHAETHTVVLPHAVAYNAPAIPEVMDLLRDALSTDDVPQALFELSEKVGAQRSLKALGMAEGGIDEAADRALANPYWNSRPLERAPIRDLIARAYAGDRPQTT